MSTIQIEGLWQYIQTLSLSARNKKWLAERLVESTVSSKGDPVKETFLSDISVAASQARNIANGTTEGKDAFDLLNEL